MAAVILVCAQRGGEVIPAAPSLAGDTLETREVTCDFPRHLHTYPLVDCTGFALKCSFPILLRAALSYPVC